MKSRGMHVIGDLHQCELSGLAASKSKLSGLIKIISGKIKKAGMTPLGAASHYFGADAVTATVILAESHVAFHTWPELNYASLDVFVCNFTKNNSLVAEKLFNDLAKNIFKAKKIQRKIIRH